MSIAYVVYGPSIYDFVYGYAAYLFLLPMLFIAYLYMDMLSMAMLTIA